MRGRSRGWVIDGFSKGLTGIVAAFAVSFLIALLLWLDIGWIKAIEREGRDLTMRTALALHGPVVDQLPKAVRGRITPITFIDVDEEGCEQLAERPAACRSEGVSQESVLAPLGSALAGSGARLIVLDVYWPSTLDSGGASGPMMGAWASQPGPKVLAVLPGIPQPGGSFQPDGQRISALSAGRLRFHPSAVWSRADEAGVIRAYPTTISMARLNGSVGPGRIASLTAAAGEALTGRLAVAGEAHILFTLPALSVPQSEAIANDVIGSWERRVLSLMLRRTADDSLAIDVQGLEGHVVVVGSSAPAAQDFRNTPVGPMTGAEIIANSIRSNQVVPAVAALSDGAAFGVKLAAIVPAMAIGLLTALAMSYWGRRRPRKLGRRIVRGIVLTGLFLTGLTLSVVASVSLALRDYLQAASQGIQTDLLLPTIAIFAEGFVSGMKWLIDRTEAFWTWGLAKLAARGTSNESTQA